MPCGGFFQGQAGQSFRMRVTSPGEERLRALLTDLDRASGQAATSQFTGATIRGTGVSVNVVAGHSYHLLLIKEPAAGAISIEFRRPSGTTKNCTDQGGVIGPWIVRA